MYKIKKIVLILCLSLIGTTAFAQTRITIEGKTISGREAQEDIWVFEDSEDSLITIRRQMYRDLTQKISELHEEREKLKTVIEAKNELIAAFENYELQAETHIQKQAELIDTADSLYVGYEDLYQDLKSIYGINTVSLLLGAGVYNYDQTELHPIFKVGGTYNQLQGTFDFGKKYFGVSIQYRIPLL